jgi:hypothetical protein
MTAITILNSKEKGVRVCANSQENRTTLTTILNLYE